MKFKAVIFDLDGTLLDSLDGIADSMNLLLEQMGYPVHPLDKYKYFIGVGITELVKRALPGDWQGNIQSASSKQPGIDRLISDYRKIYDVEWPKKTKPYSDIPKLLDLLSRKDIKIAVLSNKSHDFTRRMVLELLGGWHFDAVLGGRPGVPGKPDPAAALEIAKTIDTNPEDIVFLGDSGVDMQTAVNAGMYPVGVLWGFREAEELLANGASVLINQPMDFVDILE